MEPFVAEYIQWLESNNRWLFQRLMEYSSTMNHRLKVSFLFNAYQPRCNRKYKEKKQLPTKPDNEFFTPLYEKIQSYKIERKETDNLINVALTDCYIPLLAISEKYPNSMSISFPQITIDIIKYRYPSWHKRMGYLAENEIFDLGISSYHHSFAPLLNEKLLMQEYSASIEEHMKSVNPKEDITVHIPECAVSPTLLEVFAKLQKEYYINLITVLDSDYHNGDGAYDIGRVNEIKFFSKGIDSSIKVLFSNNHFSRRLFSFPPNSDPKTVGFWYFTRMFESVAKPQPYPYWEKMKNNEIINFTIHTDAETIGFYSSERVYSLYLMMHLMKCFDIDMLTVSDAAQMNVVQKNSIQPLLYRTWDMESGGDTGRWMKMNYDSSTQFFLLTKELYPYLIDEISNHESEMSSIEKKILWIARMRYANALTSCPHWWSEPDSVPGRQFAFDVIETGKQLRKLEKYIPEEKKEILLATKRIEDHPFIKRALKI